MRRALRACLARVAPLAVLGASCLLPRTAAAQELPRVTVTRALSVGGLTADAEVDDLLGLSRVRFHGLIASELRSVGYLLAEPEPRGPLPPLVLMGVVQEERCDDVAPRQCRITVEWELQERGGVVVYRTVTRAVEQQPSLTALRRGLVQGALRSLLARRRFTLRLSDAATQDRASSSGAPLGFKRCEREPVPLPAGAQAARAGVVIVQSGGHLSAGAILSSDGLILTSTRQLEPGAPLRARFVGRQVVPARVVASAPNVGVALLRADAHAGISCLPLREAPWPEGATAWGVESKLGDESPVSVGRSTARGSHVEGDQLWWSVDASAARVEGAPVLDENGQLSALVVDAPLAEARTGKGIGIRSALTALHLTPALVSDPRLLEDTPEGAPALGYVEDPPDPPFVLTRRYTFGTSPTAGVVRTASLITAGVGALGVGVTWLRFRGSQDMTEDSHRRLVIYNDIAWGMLALGAVGVGISYALPQAHEVVAGHGSARRITFSIAASGLGLAGEL